MKQFGLNIKIENYKKKEGRRNQSKYLICGHKREQEKNQKFNVKWSNKILLLILSKLEDSQGQTFLLKDLFQVVTRAKWTHQQMKAI